jgi:ABC-type oligopeptide transport system substrate-binding subunit
VASNVAAIGIHVRIKTFPFDVLFSKEATKGEPFDIATHGWIADGYFDPFDFLSILLVGNLAKQFPGNNNSVFDDPVYNSRLEAAAKLSGPARYAAYAKLDADLARNASPIVALGNSTSQDFFSARMGGQIYNGYGMSLAALCIRRREPYAA